MFGHPILALSFTIYTLISLSKVGPDVILAKPILQQYIEIGKVVYREEGFHREFADQGVVRQRQVSGRIYQLHDWPF
jgi:hypothetical protein